MKRLIPLTIGLALMSLASAQNTGPQFVNNMVRAGQIISNTGTLSGTQGDGTEAFSADSNTVNATVQQVGAVNITLGGVDTSTTASPGDTVTAAPGSSGELVFTVTNTGNGNDTFTLLYGTDAPDLPSAWIDLNDNKLQDAGEELPSGAQQLIVAGGQYEVHVLTPVRNGAPGSDLYYTTLQATGTVDGASDNDNVGEINVLDQLAVTLEADDSVNFTPGSTVTVTKTLTNTGNVPVSSVTVSTTETDPSNLLTFSYVVGNGTAQATLQDAINSSLAVEGPMAQNASRTVTVTATAVNTGINHLDSVTLAHTLTLTPDADDQIGPAEEDRTTYVARVFAGTNSKAQAVCSFTGSGYSCGPLDLTDKVAKPCDVVIYGITARSTNQGGVLRAPVIRDQIASTLTPLFVRAYMAINQNAFINAPDTAIVSTNKTDWSSMLNASNLSGVSTVYGGYDMNGDNAITVADQMTDENVLSLVIGAQVKGVGCAPFDENSASNFPVLPYDDQGTPLPGF